VVGFYDPVSIYVSDMCTLQRNSVVPLVQLCAIRAGRGAVDLNVRCAGTAVIVRDWQRGTGTRMLDLFRHDSVFTEMFFRYWIRRRE
jgi:hypothetical protein